MKKMIQIFLMLSVLVGCSSQTDENIMANKMQDEHLKTVQDFLNALGELDAEKAISLLSEDFELQMVYPLYEGENRYGARNSSGEPVLVYIRGIVERNKQVSFNNKIWRKADDGAIILETEGSLIRANGDSYKNQYLMIFYVDDSGITLWREYFNPVIAADVFGIPLKTLPNRL